jgi:hypothetical protein
MCPIGMVNTDMTQSFKNTEHRSKFVTTNHQQQAHVRSEHLGVNYTHINTYARYRNKGLLHET